MYQVVSFPTRGSSLVPDLRFAEERRQPVQVPGYQASATRSLSDPDLHLADEERQAVLAGIAAQLQGSTVHSRHRTG